MNEIDSKYMRRALELASLAEGLTRPNPLVGAVIVHDGKIIGEGFHTRAGEAHAEVNAIESVTDRDLLKDSSLYVNLEPCSHHGRTPPCAERIIKEGIPRVVIGIKDPSRKVCGKGISILENAGVEVITDVMEPESREINRRFFTWHEKGRPYIILKWAQSADGYIDRMRTSGSETGPNWITGMDERILVHKWRSEEEAILIGDKTACNDDPGLDVRFWEGPDPLRIVLNESSVLPPELKIFRGEPKTVIFSRNKPDVNLNAEYQPVKDRKNALYEILDYLYKNEKQSLIVEGGFTVLSQFIEAGLWDEARIFRGQVQFGTGLAAPEISGKIVKRTVFDGSILEYWRPDDQRSM